MRLEIAQRWGGEVELAKSREIRSRDLVTKRTAYPKGRVSYYELRKLRARGRWVNFHQN